MNTIYECPRCGAHHLMLCWEGEAICCCPTCQEPSPIEEIDFLHGLSKSRFWPYFLKEDEILACNPAWGKG